MALILSACNIFSPNPNVINEPAENTPAPTPTPTLQLTVTYDASVPFNAVGQEIKYSYLINNVGLSPIAGPISVIDDKVAVNCPEVTTVGNQDTNLDASEPITCTGTYVISQADLNIGSVTTLSTASATGNSSSAVSTIVALEQSSGSLTLSKKAEPSVYNNAGQTIYYSFGITNSGQATLGPSQFTVNDDKLGAAISCGANGIILLPNETVTCSVPYIITADDMTARSVTNNATATNGVITSQVVTTVISLNQGGNTSNLTPGTTIQHEVRKGEWLWQIARCYGADPKAVIQANPQLPNPAEISPGEVVTIPNIGVGGRTIYGIPCIGSHTVQSGETWNSIAQIYNASVIVLQEANPGALTPGRVLKVPLNSAGNP